MIKIYSEGDLITCTQGDEFSLTITSPDGFDDGTKLNFQVAENEEKESVLNLEFELDDGVFEITLKDTQQLPIGNYIYKIAVVDPLGRVVTRKSGELVVKWGA